MRKKMNFGWLFVAGLFISSCQLYVTEAPEEKTADLGEGAAHLVTSAKNGSGAIFGRSDSCSSSHLIATIDRNTDCTQFSNSTASWSIMIDGECRDINDTSARIACSQVSGGGAVFGRSDSCSSSHLAAVVGRKTDCNLLSNSQASWSIMKNGRCQDISDTTVKVACSQAKGAAAFFGRSDTCSASHLIAVVDRRTDCSQFSNSQASWSIMVKGECRDISDTTARIACAQAQGRSSGGRTGGAVFGRSDSCSSSHLIGTVDRRTDCNQFSSSQASWSIMINGECKDISDTNARVACSQVKGRNSGAVFGRSDSCSSSHLISTVDRRTDCNQLGNGSAWSIMVNGECRDISDTTAKIACSQVKGRRGGAVFGRSDSCSSSSLIAVVDQRTDCNQFSNSSSWSIIANGQCKDISDTTAKVACSQAKGAGAVFGRSDSCSSGSLIAVVDRNTDCNSLGSQSAWSIMVDGECKDISDTTAAIACSQARN